MARVLRQDIWIVKWEGGTGHEMTKTRPALIIQNDTGNKYSPTTIIAPLTTQKLERPFPFETIILPENSGLDRPAKVLLNHIKTVDKERLIKQVGRLDNDRMAAVEEAIKISLGL